MMVFLVKNNIVNLLPLKVFKKSLEETMKKIEYKSNWITFEETVLNEPENYH